MRADYPHVKVREALSLPPPRVQAPQGWTYPRI